MLIPTPLLESIKDGRCLPVIGAGFSLNAEMPQGKQMPDWNKLITILSKDLQTKSTDPLKIAEEYATTYGSTALMDTIRRELHIDEIKPGHVHRHFVRMPYFDVICTTNFDSLLEDACRQEGIAYHPIIDTYQLAIYGSTKELKILKIHGDFSNSDLIVFTEKDYTDYKEKHAHIANYLPSLLMTKTPLFLGYSIKDPDFIQIKDMVELTMGKSVRKGYIVLFDANKTEISEYEKMNLVVLPLQTNGKSKSDVLLDFISQIIQPLNTSSLKVTLSVKANKAILFHGQTLEIRTFANNIDDAKTIIKITDPKNHLIFNGTMADAESIGEYILSIKIKMNGAEWKEGKYTITAENGEHSVTDSFVLSEPLQIVAQTDKSVYLYNSKMTVTVVAPQAHIGSVISFKIINDKKIPIYEDTIDVVSEKTGIHQKVIQIQGDEWKKRGKQFVLTAEYEGKNASVTIYRANFGASVQLDQKVYSWSDRVFITVIAPDFNLDPNVVDQLGNDLEGTITISTSKGTISNYRLVETGVNTGIFTGWIKLTGFPGHTVNSLINRQYPWGITKGSGPIDGLLACNNNDGITVSFKFSEEQTVTGSSVIRWTVGEIQWLEPTYSIDSIAIVRVIDPDMNLNSDAIDNFKIHVWSDSDPVGIDIIVYETGTATGIFEGTVSFNQIGTKDQQLKAKDGDSAYAQYVDATLPAPYTLNDSLRLSSIMHIRSKISH